MIIIMFGYYAYLVGKTGFRSSQTVDSKSKSLETEV